MATAMLKIPLPGKGRIEKYRLDFYRLQGATMKRVLVLISVCFLIFSGVVPQAMGYMSVNLEELRSQAEKGDPEAQTRVGVIYSKGVGVEQDKKEAAKWYRKAAEQGYANGQWNLAFLYIRGEGVEEDYAEARRLFRQAADQGYSAAEYDLGIMCLDGLGGEKSEAEGLKWIRKAADHGEKDAIEFLEEQDKS